MPDRIFDDPRLAAVYDALDPDRSDLDVYLAIVRELGAASVLDVGCGTGTFAGLLVEHGCEVVGVDPAAAMLDVARRKPGADRVRWVHGTAADLPAGVHVDLAVMTGNVAQVFVDDRSWAEALDAVHGAVRAGGFLVFESRRPERQAWLEWNPADSFGTADVPGIGVVESWSEVLDVHLPLVTFRTTIAFRSDGTEVTSESTLRFRSQDELATSVEGAGFRVVEVREAPDRPGREHVVVAERS